MAYEYATAGADRPRPRLGQIVADRTPAYGVWCMMPGPVAVEIVSSVGPDWLCIDLQHGLIDEGQMRPMIQAAGIRSTPVVVRVPWNDPAAIMRALDAGADGVIVPMVNTGAESIAAAAASRFPPAGNRSWGPLRPAALHTGFSPQLGNELATCLVMVETMEAIANLDAILDAPGVDGVFLGPKDLAISHGSAPGAAFVEPELLELVQRVADACAARGLVASTICDTNDEVAKVQSMGYSMIALRADAVVLGSGLAADLAAARAIEPTNGVNR